MKPPLSILVPALMLVGCEKADQYSNGNIVALSALYDFEKIAGLVHQLHQSVFDVKGNPIHDVKAEFDRQGCVTQFDMVSKLSGNVHFKRVGNHLAGQEDNNEITYHLGDHCQLVSKTNNTRHQTTTYKYDRQGLLIASIPDPSGMHYSYQRAENGDLQKVTALAGSRILEETQYEWHQETVKVADYSLKIKTLTGESTIDMRCEYREKVPVSCDIVRLPASGSAEVVLKAKLNVTFY